MEVWLSTFGVIFAIVDPFGYIPIFLSMTSGDSDASRKRTLVRACSAAFVVLAVSAILGNHILKFFGISIPALQISGGLILMAIGFEMLNVLPIASKISAAEEKEGVQKADISIIPLAIPMLSGPASIATVVVLSSQAASFADYPAILISILVTMVITYFVLSSSSRILKLVSHTGLNVMTRIMGLLLCAMAVQYVINGYRGIQ